MEIDHNNLKGRFIFKAFADYILLLFGIEINLEYNDKKTLLKEKAKKKGIHFRDIFFIVQKMKDLYYTETAISHNESSVEEIKSTILNQFYETDYDFMSELFNKLNPEKDIQIIIKKNNELTQVMISNSKEIKNEKEKDLKKMKIISEINNILSTEKKEQLMSNLIKIIKDYYED